MKKINNEFLKLGIIPKFINYEPSKDPDEFLNEFGRLELAKRIETAPTFLDFLISKEIPSSIPQNTDQKLEILQNIFKILCPLGEGLLANEKAIYAAKRLGLVSSNDDIITEYKNYIKANASKSPYNSPNKPKAIEKIDEEIIQKPDKKLDTIKIDPSRHITKPEKLLIESLIAHPEMVLSSKMSEILDLIDHFEVKTIVQWLNDIYLEIDESEYILFVKEKIQETIPDDIKEVIASSLFKYRKEKMESAIVDKILEDLALKLKMQKLKNEREDLKEMQKRAISDEQGLEFLQKIQNIEKELFALRNK